MTRQLKIFGVITLGWLLVVAGVVALVIPGPGLLTLFAGLALLSRQYEWARRRTQPVKVAAFRAAAAGVRSWPKLLMSTAGALAFIAAGIIWGIGLPVPGWWPIDDAWWLPGGWSTGAALIVSGLAALALLAYSYRNFRGDDGLARLQGLSDSDGDEESTDPQ